MREREYEKRCQDYAEEDGIHIRGVASLDTSVQYSEDLSVEASVCVVRRESVFDQGALWVLIKCARGGEILGGHAGPQAVGRSHATENACDGKRLKQWIRSS